MSFTIRFRRVGPGEGDAERAEGPSFRSDRPIVVSEAAAQCELWIEHPCAARGNCQRCRVRFLSGVPVESAADRARLSPELRIAGWRLSCRAVVGADAVVEVPAAARGVATKSFGGDLLEAGEVGEAGDLAEPSETAGLGGALLGFAVDAGTTTLAVGLVDRATTRVLAARSLLNPQVRHGHDVLSRIHFIATHAGGAGQLTGELRTALAELGHEVLADAGATPEQVGAAVLCGNAFMTHSLAGADVVSLGRAPFLGAFTAARELGARELGLPAAAGATALLFPQVRSHVGGDAVAAMLAAGLDRCRRPELLVDLGTNSEIVVSDGARVLAASAAGGPAFEGGGISCGMRATDGAVDRVSLDPSGDLSLRVRGGGRARGLCGTGLLDAAAALLDAGVCEASGRLRRRGELPGPIDRVLADRLIDGGRASERSVVLVRGADSAEGVPIVLTAGDVRQLQLAKAAIAAGIELLLGALGLTAGELATVHVAGAFGSFLRKESVLRIGLVPDVDPERIACLGDAAGIGARMVLCAPSCWQRAEDLAHRVEHVDLAGCPAYADTFARSIALRPMR